MSIKSLEPQGIAFKAYRGAYTWHTNTPKNVKYLGGKALVKIIEALKRGKAAHNVASNWCVPLAVVEQIKQDVDSGMHDHYEPRPR